MNSSFLRNVLALICICLTLGIYANWATIVPVTMEQIVAGNDACIAHLGPREYKEQRDRDGFKVICNDGRAIEGKLNPTRLPKIKGHTT